MMLLLLMLALAQTPSTDVTITGCVQRAPDNLEHAKRFVLMTGESPAARRDTSRETGGVTYLLEGKTNFEPHAGQRVEITGAIGERVKSTPTKPTMAQPVQRLQVTALRVIGPQC